VPGDPTAPTSMVRGTLSLIILLSRLADVSFGPSSLVCGRSSPQEILRQNERAKPHIRTIQQLGASFGELTVAPATPTEPLPPLPVEVDDVHIFPNQIQPQQAGVVSLITGFNLNVRVYLSYSSLATAEMAFGVDEIFDWDRQQRIFEQSMQRCRTILESIPEVLKVQPMQGRDSTFLQHRQPYYPPMPEFSGLRDSSMGSMASSEPQDIRRYEIQKANIYASHLSTRSYLVEKYFLQLEKFTKANGQTDPPSSISALAAGMDRAVPPASSAIEDLEKNMSDEREQVFKDLLVVLGSIDMVNMEPNGDSFVSLYLHLQQPHVLPKVDAGIPMFCLVKYLFY
jgi:hypothetical protein